MRRPWFGFPVVRHSAYSLISDNNNPSLNKALRRITSPLLTSLLRSVHGSRFSGTLSWHCEPKDVSFWHTTAHWRCPAIHPEFSFLSSPPCNLLQRFSPSNLTLFQTKLNTFQINLDTLLSNVLEIRLDVFQIKTKQNRLSDVVRISFCLRKVLYSFLNFFLKIHLLQ